MKILHTSDWHLGVPLGKERVMDLQNEWMDQLLAIADNEGWKRLCWPAMSMIKNNPQLKRSNCLTAP